MNLNFSLHKESLGAQFAAPEYIVESGVSREELNALVSELEGSEMSKALIKAKTLALIAEKARIAVDKQDIFQDKVMGYGIIAAQRRRWENAVKSEHLAEESKEIKTAWGTFGAYNGIGDYGHTSPNTQLLVSEGFVGLLDKIENASKREGLTDKQKEFYLSCEICLNALITLARRLAKAVEPYNKENAEALENIANGAPKTLYEVMQLIILYFFTHEYVGATRVRTLGRLDVLLYPFYKNDIESGRYTKDEIKEMLKYFLYKFWSAKVPFGLPFCLGGIDENGDEVTNEISYMIVEVYNSLDIYSPKIHIRVSDKTPESFVKLVLSCIRGGNSSFVFVNDEIGIKSLMRVGICEKDARNYLPIGCYEPAVWGVEIGCTGNGGVNLAKAVELVFCNGKDNRSGLMCGVETGKIDSYEAFIKALKKQIKYMTEKATDYVVNIERHYKDINPDPLLSCQYVHSVEKGIDVYEGGAKYNNSSMYLYSIASLVDSVCAVKELVFDKGIVSFDELGDILKSDWRGHEKMRAAALRLDEKYGNNTPLANALAVEFSEYCADLVNNKPNGRGGVFKAALFSIDECFRTGARTMATPDGRHFGEPLSKNLCATVGMDKKGITSLISSVTAMDHSSFPTGSVLDVVLHPSALAGSDGLDAFFGILTTYFKKGGFAMHGNVFDALTLKKAQNDPQKYKNLQVRVCGWNAYFIDLTKAEQDAFIKQAEGSV